MPKLDDLHWLVEQGDNWGTVATACGVNRLDLARANNATISGSNVTPSLKAGQMIHVPFVGVIR